MPGSPREPRRSSSDGAVARAAPTAGRHRRRHLGARSRPEAVPATRDLLQGGTALAMRLTRRGEFEMKHWIAAAASVGIAIGALSAQAAEKKVEDITCEEFLAMKPENQNRIAYWVAGFAAGTSQDVRHAGGVDKFGQPIGELVTDCEATPQETLWEEGKK